MQDYMILCALSYTQYIIDCKGIEKDLLNYLYLNFIHIRRNEVYKFYDVPFLLCIIQYYGTGSISRSLYS